MIEVVGFIKGMKFEDHAYFRAGDIIVKYDGIAVTSLEQLVALMQRFRFFGKVKIQLVRNNRPMNIKVKKGILGLKLEERGAGPSPLVDRALLEKANLIIRKANIRINELKAILGEYEYEIDLLREKNDEMSLCFEKMCQNFSHLDVLGYETPPNPDELKKRYRQLAAIYHPDKGGSKAMMQKINEAYETLEAP